MRRFIMVAALLVSTWPAAVLAQPPCQFVLGFADLRDRIGATIVGDCLEDQRTLTGEERIPLPADRTVKQLPLRAGVTVQQTTMGVLVWNPETNVLGFSDGNDLYSLDDRGLRVEAWSDLLARLSATPTPTTPPPPTTTPRPAPPPPTATPRATSPPPTPSVPPELAEARGVCSRANTEWMITTLYESEAVQQRAEAEANAKTYLCEQALERDGPRGVACFVHAWDAARGMEQVFAGSGRQTYDNAYARCMTGR